MRDKDNTLLWYVEVVVIAITLGVFAVAVTPKFTLASNEAKISRLVDRLQITRSQIQLYKIQHIEQLPGGGLAPFEQALTRKTNITGALDAAGPYGPYLKDIPENPFNNLNTVEVEQDSRHLGGGNCGWHFNSKIGAFHADTDAHKSL